MLQQAGKPSSPMKSPSPRWRTRETFKPLLENLIGRLPEENKANVSSDIKTVGYKHLKFAVAVSGGQAREVAQRWQEWFWNRESAEIVQHMSDEVQLAFDSEKVKVFCEFVAGPLQNQDEPGINKMIIQDRDSETRHQKPKMQTHRFLVSLCSPFVSHSICMVSRGEPV